MVGWGLILGAIAVLVLAVLGSRFISGRNSFWENAGIGLIVMVVMFPVAAYLGIKLLDLRLTFSTLIGMALFFFLVGLILSKNVLKVV